MSDDNIRERKTHLLVPVMWTCIQLLQLRVCVGHAPIHTPLSLVADMHHNVVFQLPQQSQRGRRSKWWSHDSKSSTPISCLSILSMTNYKLWVTADLLARLLFKTSIHFVIWSVRSRYACYAYSPHGHKFLGCDTRCGCLRGPLWTLADDDVHGPNLTFADTWTQTVWIGL